MQRTPLVAFSHLRWEFVTQRPQHVMTRLARHRPVLFVEEPLLHDAPPSLEVRPVAPNVTMARAHLPIDGPAFGRDQQPALDALLRDHLRGMGWDEWNAWLYTPLAIDLVEALRPSGIVYDCMDELSAFLGAPPELLAAEERLLARADAVFTGGPSLFEAKRHRHRSVHCFPSSVDAAHFANHDIPEARDQASLPSPRLGYYGVIDERIDPEVVDAVANAFPDAAVIMLGPIVKIDPASLPRHSNLHYLGSRPYGELPAYVRGWDLALMPFAIGPATRYISPTKVLEYMAASRPIASTPIHDVEQPYGDIVYVGAGPRGFVEACERALGATDAERRTRAARAAQVIEHTSWDRTAERMERILDGVAEQARAADAPLTEIRA